MEHGIEVEDCNQGYPTRENLGLKEKRYLAKSEALWVRADNKMLFASGGSHSCSS